MIRVLLAFAALVIVAVYPAAADTRAVYTITDIPVDASASSVIEARQKAQAQAKVIGARALINKITLATDRSRAGGLSVDYATANRLAAAVDVQEETAGAGRYRGVMSAVLNPREVRAFLDQRGVAYVDRQGPLGLLVPTAPTAQIYKFREELGAGNNGALSPYVVSSQLATGSVTWDKVASEVSSKRADRAIVAALSGSEGAYSVRLTSVTASGNQSLGTGRSAPTMKQAMANASAMLDEQWKKQAVIRSTSRTLQQATMRYTSLTEWNKLRSALARSPLISEFQMDSIAKDGAMVSFSFAGDNSRLANDLRQRGVSLETNRGGWVMKSAVSR